MNILHYFLGFPPYRSGGMTKFAVDLIKEEVANQHNVTALWPGTIFKVGGKPKAKKRKPIEGISNYELINPLPIPLDEGINQFDEFTRQCDISVYISFLNEIAPDVIHIHTLMGLHREFIKAANKLDIRIVFTSHDYFGLCPKVTLYRQGECCDNDYGCRACVECNLSALSINKIQLLQSPLYRRMKDTKIVKEARKWHRNNFFEEEILTTMPEAQLEVLTGKYIKLRAYYVDMLESIDFIHFNSYLTERIYRRYMTPRDSRVISLSHRDISKHRVQLRDRGEKIVFLYLAPAKPYKGFECLKKALDNVWKTNKNFELRIFAPVKNPSSYMVVQESGYKYDELSDIMREADLLIAPSICYETFGFTVLEALSFGIPVLVSNHVGAQDITGAAGIVFSAGNVAELQRIIEKLTIEQLNVLCSNVSSLHVKTWEEFVKEMFEVYIGKKLETCF